MKIILRSIALAAAALSLAGCVWEPAPLPPPGPPVAYAPGPGVVAGPPVYAAPQPYYGCCYAYPAYPPYGYGYYGPAYGPEVVVGVGGGGGRRWR